MIFTDIYPHWPWYLNSKEYDCSHRSHSEWVSHGVQNQTGVFSIITGIITLTLYIFLLIVLSDKEFLKLSCYKLVYFTCLLDSVNVVLSNIVTGWFKTTGANFCTHPKSNFFFGSLVSGFWCGYCVSVMNLALNRFAEVTGYGKHLFKGSRTLLWIIFSTFIGIFITFFTRPTLYNFYMDGWLIYPVISDDTAAEAHIYTNIFHTICNFITASVTLCCYICIFLFLYSKKKLTEQAVSLSKLQKNLLLQTFLICSCFVLGSYLYIYVLYFSTPQWVIMLVTVLYGLGQFMPLVALLFLNKSIRLQALAMLGIKKTHRIVITNLSAS